MARIGIIFGSTTGNTESAARKIHEALGNGAEAPRSISEVSAEELAGYDALVLGVSTWGAGDLQDNWEDALPKLDSIRLTRKKVAVFGLGDQEGYSDTFVDAIGTVARKVLECGAQLVGMVSTDGYEFDASTAVVDGKFVGLPLDDDNQSDRTDARIAAWVETLKTEFA